MFESKEESRLWSAWEWATKCSQAGLQYWYELKLIRYYNGSSPRTYTYLDNVTAKVFASK